MGLRLSRPPRFCRHKTNQRNPRNRKIDMNRAALFGPRARKLIIWLILNWKMIRFGPIWYESTLELQSSLFSWFFIEQIWSLTWSPAWSSTRAALELIIWWIINWKCIKFDMNRVHWIQPVVVIWLIIDLRMMKLNMNLTWSSSVQYVIDFLLRIHQTLYESSRELQWSYFTEAASELIMFVIFKQRMSLPMY